MRSVETHGMDRSDAHPEEDVVRRRRRVSLVPIRLAPGRVSQQGRSNQDKEVAHEASRLSPLKVLMD
jgi:hypothetical protein